MPEDQVVVENEVKETGTPVAASINPFDDNSWSITPIELQEEATKKEVKPVAVADSEEIVDELEYLERQTGFKSWDDIKALKTEAEQLRTKAQTPAERKFANEASKQLAEAWEAGETEKVWEYLDTQRRLKKSAELPSADAIREHLKQTNPHFKPEDIEDVFEERYTMPKKPVQGADEDKDTFDERMTEYNTRVAKVNRAIERDAVTAKSELAKRITELVPPEIPKQQSQQGPTQEVLDARKAVVDNFRKEAPKQIEAFKGFSTTVKDDVVELPISYAIRAEEMNAYKQELESFAENGLDVNTLFAKRWLNKDGSINIQRIAEELYLLDNKDKIFKAIANDSAYQRLNHQIKLNSNIKVNGEKTTTHVSQPDPKKAQVEYIWENG